MIRRFPFYRHNRSICSQSAPITEVHNNNTNTLTFTQWNLQLRELSKQNQFKQGLILYLSMLRSSYSPNSFTFPFVLKSCAALSLLTTGQQLHTQVLKTGCQQDTYAKTSLISLYCKCHLIDDARKVFDESPLIDQPNVCYNALIAGYSLKSRVFDAVSMFQCMRVVGVVYDAVTMLGLIPVCCLPSHLSLGTCLHGFMVKCGLVNDVSVGNCLLTMYIRCGSVELARNLFDEMPEKALITWNAMINGYAQNGLATYVLDLYRGMQTSGLCPDSVTLLGVLSSCAYLGARSVGFEVEKEIQKRGLHSNSFLKNQLINMHARCGNLAKARDIFDRMNDKSLVSWTAIIGGYGIHGRGDIAVNLFNDMIKSGIQPDRTIFVSVLSACSHAGLTDKGLSYFESMQRDFGLEPEREHYSCMVDLLGRAGRLQEAYDLTKSMPMEPDAAVWGALLGACKIHKDVELAEMAFEEVTKLEPSNIGYYVLLANIYKDARNTEGIMKVRVMMRDRKLKKEPGYSYVNCKGRNHTFLAGDKSHRQADEIFRMLNELEGSISELGWSRKCDDQEGEKEEISSSTRVHSERLAIAFAILNTMPSAEIVVIKNLRVCEDCHLFITLVSKAVDRKFIVRDASRFHHFEKGSCSCNDYW